MVLSSGAVMLAMPLSPRRRGGQTLQDTARFTPSSDMFLPRPLTRCVWGGAELFVGVARLPRALRMRPRPSFRPRKVARGCASSNPAPKGGNPPVPHCFSGQCGRKSGHFFSGTITECAWKRWAFLALSSSS